MDDLDAYQQRINNLIEIDENHQKTFDHLTKHQDKVNKKIDKKACQCNLQIGDLVLLWDKRREDQGKHGKFDNFWLGPYQITDIAGPNAFSLSHMDGEIIRLPINGKALKRYFSDIV